jgi:GT2 family glycosyltransferase
MLPAEMVLEFDASVRRIDDGRVLVGGSPIRLLRLTESGARTIARWTAGEPVGSSVGGRRLARRLLDGGLAHPRSAPSVASVASDRRAGEVTVVIPVFGTPDGLARTLAALAADATAAAVAVVVVDDGSGPADAAAIAEAGVAAGARVVRLEVNSGPGAARNRGLDEVTTAFVAFVDSQVEPSTGWLSTLLPHFDDPAVAAVAPRVVVPEAGAPRAAGIGGAGGADVAGAGGPCGDVLARFERDRSPLDLGPDPARVASRTRVAYVPTTTLVGRVDALTDVGVFDDRVRFGEDVDLVWRLVEAGWTVRYEPAVSVGHPPRPDMGAWLRQRFDYGQSAAVLAERHPGALAPLSISMWSASAWGLAVAGFPLTGVAVAAVAAAQLPRRLSGLERPWAEGLRLAGGGTWAAWRPLSSAVTRTWWPVGLGAALVSRRARRAVLAAALVPPLVDWWQGDRQLDPLRYTALRLLDDLAYGAGVWAGCARYGTIEPLVPDLHSWPGHTRAVESG